ncbi:MAG: HEAT repeat domain-containing protein [Phycisphaerales bacterium]|nr:HEAT repeat domain-containing protein [Phycisphaerales bacterium]
MRILALAILCLVALPGCVFDDFNDVGGIFTPKTPTEAARDALDPYSPDLRREGIVLLSNATFGGAEIYLEMYRTYVADETDPLVRAAAIAALGRHGTPEDAMRIVPWLDPEVSRSANVRWVAAKALQRLHNAQAVEPLIDAMTNSLEEGEVKAAAAIALGQYQEDRVFQALLMALDDRRLSVNLDAAQSLAMLTGESFGIDRVAWQRWYQGLADKSTLFSGHRDYYYPTYARNKLWFEYIAFWLQQNHETPMQPAGLRPSTPERKTWDEDTPPAPDAS